MRQAFRLDETVDPNEWEGTSQGFESTLHQIAPYIGRMKSRMAQCLIESYSQPGDIVLDPFVGSGVVALESAIRGRGVICCDFNPYAVTLTKAKLTAPPTLDEALARVQKYLHHAKKAHHSVNFEAIPNWVKQFFHPRTLQEVTLLSEHLRANNEYFLLGCLLGILHHQRPGFLSFPSSHLVPYLRTKKFPMESYPELYEYRDITPRLEHKIRRIYRRFTQIAPNMPRVCIECDACDLDLLPNSVNAVITSPPYMNALSYGRDNRLRLWFLGVSDYGKYDRMSPRNPVEFRHLMARSLALFQRALLPGAVCVLVLGEVDWGSSKIDTAELVMEVATKGVCNYNCEALIDDIVPESRRSRKGCNRVQRERIVVLRKSA